MTIRALPKWILAAIAFLAATAGALAQAAPTARIEPQTVYPGDGFQVVLSHAENFQVVSGADAVEGQATLRNRNARFQFHSVNGAATFAYAYDYQARSEGEFSIGPFVVEVRGKQIEIPAQNGKVQPVPKGGDTAAIGTKGLVQDVPPQDQRTLAESLFTAVEFPETIRYGEPFHARTMLYYDPNRVRTSLRLHNGQFPPQAAFSHIEGYLADSIAAGRGNKVELNGKTYVVVPLADEVVAPIRSGKVSVSGIEAYVVAGMQVLHFSPPSREVEVLPLPEAPPDVVDVVVGQVVVGVALDKPEIDERDAVTLTVRLSGRAWLETASLRNLPAIDGLEGFSGQDERDYGVDNMAPLITHATLSRTFRAVRPGEIEIPSLSFGVFDPEKGEMTVQKTEPLKLTVRPRAASGVSAITTAGPSAPAIDREGARVLDDKGILFIDTRPLAGRAPAAGGVALWKRPGYLAVHATALAAALAFCGLAARSRRIRGDVRLSRALAAGRRAGESLREAERLAGPQAPPDAFYGALAKGLLNGVAAVTGREASGLTIEEADDRLKASGAADDLRARLRRLLEKCDAMRYAPASGAQAMEADIADARAMLAEIGRLGK